MPIHPIEDDEIEKREREKTFSILDRIKVKLDIGRPTNGPLLRKSFQCFLHFFLLEGDSRQIEPGAALK